MNKFFIILSSFLLTAFSSLSASQVSVRAQIDSTRILVGDQAVITLSVSKQRNANVIFPVIKDTIAKGIEVVGITNRDTVDEKNDMQTVSQRIVVTGFDSTLALIPPFVFFYNGDSIETDELSLKVLPISVDTIKKDIRDIKPIYKAPINWKFIIELVLLILIVIAVLILAYRYYKKYHSQHLHNVEEKQVPADPYALAISKLDRIKAEKLWQKGEVKRFYTDITYVLREYIKYRYGIDAHEMTSDEILDNLKQSEKFALCEDKNLVFNDFQQILSLSDLVKFAKVTPTFSDDELAISTAYDIVEHTRETTSLSESSDNQTDSADNNNTEQQ